MSNSNGYNPNSLFALEHSLLGNNPAYQIEQFSAEEIEESEDDRNRGVEAQAFDWDDAIALEYDEDTDPDSESMSEQDTEELEDEEDTARSMSWQNYGYTSRGFDAEAFEAEEEETEEPLSRSNSLFALEQSVFGVTPSYQPSVQFSVGEEAEVSSESIESQAFDWDEAIALEYSETLYPTPMSLDWQPSDYSSQSFNLENEPATYNVEAFEDEEESEAAPANEDYPGSATYGFDAEDDDVPAHPQESFDNSQAYAVDAEDDVPAPKQDESDNSQAYGFDTDDTPEPISQKSRDSEAIPVNATVATPPSPPRKSAQPVEALSDDDFDEFDRGTVSDRAADAEAFAADLAAILRGEKVYEPPAETPAEAPPAPQPQPQPAPQSQAQSVPPKKSSPHDIFDQMGKNMAHATAFDLGTFSLEQRFDEFDRLLDEQESGSLNYEEYPAISGSEDTSKSAQSFAFDEEELEADVAALSAEEPWQATQFAITDDEIEALIEDNPQLPTEVPQKYIKRLKTAAERKHGKKNVDSVAVTSIERAVNQRIKEKSATAKVTPEQLKERYWHHISIGGSKSNPNALTGYHWSGYESDRSMFTRIGKPTKKDHFGVYQQSIQQKGKNKKKSDNSTFFPDEWTEKHFDDFFSHFANRKDFKAEVSGTYKIEAAIGGNDRYIGMEVLFMPNKQGEGSCIPTWPQPAKEETGNSGKTEILSEEKAIPYGSIYTALGWDDNDSPYNEMYALDSEQSYSPYGSAYAALNEDDNLYDSMYAAMGTQEDMEESDRTHPPEVAMQMGLLFTISSGNTGLINALKSKEKFLDPIFINDDLQKQNQSVLIPPIVKSSARDPKAWHLIDKNKKAYYVRLTATGDLEVHDAPPVPPVPPVPFNLNALNWQAIQGIQKSPSGMTGGVTILTDRTGQRFFMKGIYGTTRRMLLNQYFLSLNPKIQVPRFKRLTQQQFQHLIESSKNIDGNQSLNFLVGNTQFGKWSQQLYSEIILMSNVGGFEIEDLLAQDPRAIYVFDPEHAIGKAFFSLLGYILGCDVFVSNPDRLIKPKKHDNWHATLVPANPVQAIQDILLATLDNESSLLEKSPNLTPEEYCELLTTADLTRSEKLLRKYNDMAHGQTLEMVGVELIADPDLNKSILLRTFIAEMLKGLLAGVKQHPKIPTAIKDSILLLDTSQVNADSLENKCIVQIILGVNNARDKIFEEMRQVTPGVLSKQKPTHFISQLFAAEEGEIPDLGFNLQALVLRHLYLEHRRHMTVEQAKEDILKRIK
jgi:Bacterial EndoU nuclease